jgi:hypothetical protein
MKHLIKRINSTLPLFLVAGMLLCAGCKKYLDIVPDNVATIDYAFNLRQEAEKYLFTCYSYLPDDADYGSNPAFGAGDEAWQDNTFNTINHDPLNIAMGNQSAPASMMGSWGQMYKGIRDCNIFLENIDKVVDLQPYMKTRWVAEVKFLKGYYHWCLLRMYGPVPIVDQNLPISSNAAAVRVSRQPVDSVVNYIARLYDAAIPGLPPAILSTNDELGRLTAPIALAMKARLLVTAASPLFNGNADYASLKNKDGRKLFTAAYDATKWTRAAEACRLAIAACEEQNIKLYEFYSSQVQVSDVIKQEMTIRNSICEKWNQELIWGSSNSRAGHDLQRLACPTLDPARLGNQESLGQLAPPLKIVEQFYSKNGVPINEDKTWDYNNRYTVKAIPAGNDDQLQEGYMTASVNLDREPRFYADISFDGAKWFMLNNNWDIQNKFGQYQAQKTTHGYSVTGYYAKKLVNWKYVINEGQSISWEEYPWPICRLGDLYLLYAEALNETSTIPPADAYEYLNRIRTRAGIPTVQAAWETFSRNPTKYKTQAGLRAIIQQERLIEMAFEGSRFWDLRRWKRAADELNKNITGWDISQTSTAGYYRVNILFNQTFQGREYLWPIQSNELLINPDLVQNTGW